MTTARADQPGGERGSVLNAFANPFVKLMERWMPDAFIFAILLTILTFVLAITVAGQSPQAAVIGWGDGVWKLLTFTAQISMTLVTGYALANTPLMQRGINAAASSIHSAGAAYTLVTFVATAASLVSWGMGLIVGAVVAREVANVCRKRNVKVHYPLLVASGYAGFVLWHQGLSSSVALKVAEEGHFLSNITGTIPLSDTLLSSTNIIIVLVVFLTLPFVMRLMRPADKDCIEFDPGHVEPQQGEHHANPTPAERISESRWLNWIVGLAGVFYLVSKVMNGGTIDLNFVNFGFLIAGILLTNSPIHYVRLITDGGRTLGPIILQYPFYAGIMGIMMSSGLAQIMSEALAVAATADTLPFWAMISGGVVNMFVPSGGGQWAVQGPVMMEAATQLGADQAKVALGVAIGDQWTNMLQPFWTIPALAIAGLRVRDVMGYCVIAFIWTGIIFSLGLLYL
ncbi:short-chain fatty acid transporter [Xanthobacter sp. TB0139]|uniref:short-chain fatty acid transporter n=1 Tax=Xanthobacter sp. TB0139 TaxID=3459178 RepID=UPI00403A1D35